MVDMMVDMMEVMSEILMAPTMEERLDSSAVEL